MKILIINGPNLNLLGKREPEIYGRESFETYFDNLKSRFSNISLTYEQSNHEGILIDLIQNATGKYDGIVLNAGAYTHTSIALADAIAAINIPVIEVHISNIYKREEFRKKSMLTPYCRGMITGLGLDGYKLAIDHLITKPE